MRLIQLLFIAGIIPECIDQGAPQTRCVRRAAVQEMPEGAQQTADTPNREPGRDSTKSDVAEKEQGEQHRWREYAIGNIIQSFVIHDQAQRASIGKGRWIEKQ